MIIAARSPPVQGSAAAFHRSPNAVGVPVTKYAAPHDRTAAIPGPHMNWIEAVAVVFGIVCVALTVRQSIWCWPAGLVQVTLYVYVFYGARLYSDMILHVIYIGVQVYGWHHWLHGAQRSPSGSGVRASLPVTMLRAESDPKSIGVPFTWISARSETFGTG